MTNNTCGNVTNTRSATESAAKLKSELENAFKSAKSVAEKLEIFENMASDSRFKEYELAVYIWSITRTLMKLKPSHNPEQVFSFGKTALTILTSAIHQNIGNIACFGSLRSKIKIDNTRSHGLSLFIACVWYLLGSCCYDLKRYHESLRYLDLADKNLSQLEEDDNSRCAKNCVRDVLSDTQQLLYNVKVAMGKKDEAAVHARKVLMFKELMMDGNCIELGDGYIDAYEAYVAAKDAKEAIPLCLKALEIYNKYPIIKSLEIATLMVDLAVLYCVVGKHEKADEQEQLWKSVLRNTGGSDYFLKAELRGATMLINFGKYKEAIDVLEVVASRADTDEGGRVSSFLTMATASCMLENYADVDKYMRAAKTILEENDIDPIFVSIVYLEMSGLYEKIHKVETAISLSKRVWEMSVHHQEITEGLRKRGHQKLLAASSTRLFSLISLAGREDEEMLFMIDVAEKLEQIFGPVHIEVGYGCAKLGAALINMGQENLAVQLMERAKYIMDVILGHRHMDSLRMSHTLSQLYAKLGRYNEAAEIQVEVVENMKGLEPSEQQFMDKAVGLLNLLMQIVAQSPTSASSQTQDDKDLSAENSECGTSGDDICPA